MTERKRPAAAGTAPDEALLRDIVAAFTRHPKDILVQTVNRGENSEMIQFEVNRDDHPRVVGGQGKHVQALRTIFQFIAAREERQIRLMLLEPKRGTRQENLPFRPNLDWKPDGVLDLLRRILGRIFKKPFNVEAISAEETTNIEIKVDASEQNIMDALKPSLHPIFHAIGKNEGRQLYIETPDPVPVMNR